MKNMPLMPVTEAMMPLFQEHGDILEAEEPGHRSTVMLAEGWWDESSLSQKLRTQLGS